MIARLAAILLAVAAPATAAVFDFPTANRALLDGRPEDFFMYVPRDFEGQQSFPWEGGQFGFVRGPRRTPAGVIFATLHEGIDIKPLRRDASGNPLDDVLASAAGTVVHASAEAGASNYGRYVVIEHDIDGALVYTLYAHLASIAVQPGQRVRQGETIGRMGFTGAALDRARAHLHFEITLLLNRNFEGWHEANFKNNPNKHGIYNGLNLAGSDPAEILKACASSPNFRFAKYLASLEPDFKVTIPNTGDITLIRDCPWLVPEGEVANPPAWTIWFTGTGLPVRVVASNKSVAAPEIAWTRDSSLSYAHVTRGLVGGPPGSPRLTDSGQRLMSLLSWPAPGR